MKITRFIIFREIINFKLNVIKIEKLKIYNKEKENIL
jgi:hypothetical protein